MEESGTNISLIRAPNVTLLVNCISWSTLFDLYETSVSSVLSIIIIKNDKVIVGHICGTRPCSVCLSLSTYSFNALIVVEFAVCFSAKHSLIRIVCISRCEKFHVYCNWHIYLKWQKTTFHDQCFLTIQDQSKCRWCYYSTFHYAINIHLIEIH